MGTFETEYAGWLERHAAHRTGDRKSRLLRGHGHGERMFLERIWWPLMGGFDGLHPEYEVADWRGRPYFIDLAWLSGLCKFAFEVKGYGPHVQETDRVRYRRELDRETYLQIMGFRVVSIPYDTLSEQPGLTMSLIKSLLGPYLAQGVAEAGGSSRLEHDVLRRATIY